MSVCPLRSVRNGFLSMGALLLALAPACSGDDGPEKLVEERGVWSLVAYDLSGEGPLRQIEGMTRRDAFLLDFDSANNVVTAAWCGLDETATPNSSTCRLQPEDSNWYCRCFGYAYEGSRMRWVEFDAGAVPPRVTLGGAEPMPAGETEDEDEGEGEGAPAGDGTSIVLSDVATQASTYDFKPLPEGVFASNGETSAFRMQQKAPSVFDQVTCTPCLGD